MSEREEQVLVCVFMYVEGSTKETVGFPQIHAHHHVSPPLETRLNKHTPFQAGFIKPTSHLASVTSGSVRMAPDGEGKLNSH